jgi:hypothetical protein
MERPTSVFGAKSSRRRELGQNTNTVVDTVEISGTMKVFGSVIRPPT